MPQTFFNKPAFVLAPHLVYPTRNGADLLADRTAVELSKKVPFVDLIGADEQVRYTNGRETARFKNNTSMRSKPMAAVRTVLFQSHYFKEKFITPAFTEHTQQTIKNESYGVIVCSYVVTTEALGPIKQAGDVVIALTHNDEFVWFADLERKTNNWLGKLAARSSSRWLKSYFSTPPPDVHFAHVSESDLAGYAPFLAKNRSFVMPIGADIPEQPVGPRIPNTGPPTVLFVGSLGIRMNFDALQHFATTFYRSLSSEAPLKVMVAGSNPSKDVQNLCDRMGWEIHPNVTDERLRELYDSCDAAFLPFEYATGSKLKLLGALAQGVPFLATTPVDPPANLIAAESVVSNHPDDWQKALEKIHREGISAQQRTAIRGLAEPYSWARSVEHLTDHLNSLSN